MARVNDLEHALRRAVRGSVRFDQASRLLYSTDASMYQVEPLGVVTPLDADDVRTRSKLLGDGDTGPATCVKNTCPRWEASDEIIQQRNIRRIATT